MTRTRPGGIPGEWAPITGPITPGTRGTGAGGSKEEEEERERIEREGAASTGLTAQQLAMVPKPRPVEVAPELAKQKPRIEKAQEEQYGRRREAVILEAQRERLAEANELARRQGISAAEALQRVGAPIAEHAVQAAKAQRIKEATKEVVKKAEKTLEPYKADGGYDLNKALDKLGKPTLLSLGFTENQIKKVQLGQFEQQLTSKRFNLQNEQLPDGVWVDKLSLEALKKDEPEAYSLAIEKGYGAAQGFLQGKAVSEAMKKGVGEKFTSFKSVIDTAASLASYVKSQVGTPKGATTLGAEIVVPGVYVARHFNDLSASEKAIFITLDVVSLIPFITGPAAAAREVGTVGKFARLGKAGAALGREAVTQLRAPIDMVIHPLETTKSTAKGIRNLAEIIAHPKRLPEAVITTSNGTVRLKVTNKTTAAEAKVIADKLTELAAKGERPIVQVGDNIVELTRSPLMREVKGGLAHATPSGEAFKEGLKVTTKPGMALSEQGLFFSHEPLPRFTEASAFGKAGEKPAIIIVSKETAAKAITTDKLYKSPIGLVAEMERKLPVGAEVPKPKQVLFTRIGATGQRVEIFLEKPLSARQIAKLKAEGLIEVLKAPFKEPIKIKRGSAITGLTTKEIKKLSKVLRASGNIDQARSLVRAYELARSARSIAPVISRITRFTPLTGVRARGNMAITNRGMRERINLARQNRAEAVKRIDVNDRLTGIERVDREKVELKSQRVERVDTERQRVERERPLRGEPLRGEPPRGEPLRGEPPRGEPPRGEPLRGEPLRGEPLRGEPLRGEPLRGEPPKQILPKQSGGKKEEEWTPVEVKSALAWKSGAVVHAIKAPYRRGIDERTFSVKRLPSGLKLLSNYKGKGSAERSATAKGLTPKRLTVDVGNQDLLISRGGNRRFKLQFRPDRRIRTRSQTTIKRHNISRRKFALRTALGG